jgi:hypothetical protein
MDVDYIEVLVLKECEKQNITTITTIHTIGMLVF